MKRAFLSHSSIDKAYVDRVYENMGGRSAAIFDKAAFEAGEPFLDEIAKNLNNTALFVFFASKQSLASLWCKVEIIEAEKRIKEGSIEKFLTIIIDRDLGLDDLPGWMKSVKIITETRPKHSARIILDRLVGVDKTSSDKPFIGRQILSKAFFGDITGTAKSPRIIYISGLEGIGRKEYLRRQSRDQLSLTLGPSFHLTGDKYPSDFYLWLSDDNATVDDTRKAFDAAKEFAACTPEVQVDKTVALLDTYAQSLHLPCIIDDGGLLDDAGDFMPFFKNVFARFANTSHDGYIGIVSRRALQARYRAAAPHLLWQYVQALDQRESAQLLQLLLRSRGVSLSPDDLALVAEHSDGYPLAIIFSANYIKQYGPAILKSNLGVIREFKEQRFTSFIRGLDLFDDDRKVIQYLAHEGELRLEHLCAGLGIEEAAVAGSLSKLLDLSLVEHLEYSFSISAPIRDAVIAAYGRIKIEEYLSIANRLRDKLWSNNQVPDLNGIDATIHALFRAGQKIEGDMGSFVRPSDLHRIAVEKYRLEDYEDANAYAKRALDIDNTRVDLRALQFKCLVKLEKWELASGKLDEIKTSGDRKFPYLAGFLYKHKREFTKAIEYFELARSSGDSSTSVNREHADCLFVQGKYVEALKMVELAYAKAPGNLYIVDLHIRILLKLNKLAEAKALIDKLYQLDEHKYFAHHREARYWVKKHDWKKALEQAELALNTGRARQNALLLKADALIGSNDFLHALPLLDQLADKFRDTKKDILNGLRIKLLLRQGKWKDADWLWSQIEDKERTVHLILRESILRMKIADPSASVAEKAGDTVTAESIRKKLKTMADYTPDYQDLDIAD